MEQRLYAFWKYDLFPFCLGAEVEEFKKDGWVKVKDYGGSSFKAFKICLYEEGIQIKADLDHLEGQYGRAKRELKEHYLEMRNDLITIPK